MPLNEEVVKDWLHYDIKLPNDLGYINLKDFYIALQSGDVTFDDRGYFIHEINAPLPTKSSPYMGEHPKEIFHRLNMMGYIVHASPIDAQVDEVDSEVIILEDTVENFFDMYDDGGFEFTFTPTNMVIIALIGYLILVKK